MYRNVAHGRTDAKMLLKILIAEDLVAFDDVLRTLRDVGGVCSCVRPVCMTGVSVVARCCALDVPCQMLS